MTGVRPLVRAASAPLATARVAAWTWSEARRLPGSLRHQGMAAVDTIRPAPPVAAVHRSTVTVILRLSGANCLERSAILQRWETDHDGGRPLVVGVARDSEGEIAAHAWLEGDGDGDGYLPLHRRPASVALGNHHAASVLEEDEGQQMPRMPETPAPGPLPGLGQVDGLAADLER